MNSFIKSRKVILVLLMALFMPFIFSFWNLHAEGKIVPKTVRVGYYENEIFQEGAKDKTPKYGYAYEYYRKLSEYTGWKYEYVYGDFNEIFDKLKNGEVDLMAGLAYHKDRESQISYPELPMGNENYYLLSKKNVEENNSGYIDYANLSGKRISVLNSLMVVKLENWLKENKIQAKIDIYETGTDVFDAFDNGKDDLIMVEGAGTYGRKDAVISAYVGSSDYYLCVNKNRSDLVNELNRAQQMLQTDEPHYQNLLYSKYYSNSISKKAFSASELEWLKNHDNLKIGYLNNYYPYCDTDKNGDVSGILPELIQTVLDSLELNSTLKVSYSDFDSFSQMIENLHSGNIDVVFPVGGGLYYSEENGLYQSVPVANTTVSLVFSEYKNETEGKIFAVNKNNTMQEYFIKSNYPDSNIIYCDGIEGCLDAIKTGKADFTTVNGLRVDSLLKNSKYRNLKSIILSQADDRSFGVPIGNEGLLKILNRGMTIINSQYVWNLAYKYTDNLYRYTFFDFVRNNILIIIFVVLVFVSLIFYMLIKDSRKKQNYIVEETRKNAKLQKLQQEQKSQLDEIKVLNQELERARDNREKHITEMIRFASSDNDADRILDNLLSYIGKSSDSDRVYIFEENENHNWDNTYEWCREGVTAEIGNLQNVPNEGVIEYWIQEFKEKKNVKIQDIEEYKKVNEDIYNYLKPQGINTLVVVPIISGGKITGFFGVDNPPYKHIDSISDFLKLAEFVFSMMIRIRNNTRAIEDSAVHDQLTGCKNRKALVWAYEGQYSREKSCGIVSCDMNGLKLVNDSQGHEAGDNFICRMSETLKEIYGSENVYRMGGDEFLVVLMEKSREEFDRLNNLCSIQVGTTASLGIIFEEKAVTEFSELLRQADFAMYKAKDTFYQDKRKNK